jgi:hypothetical protein
MQGKLAGIVGSTQQSHARPGHRPQAAPASPCRATHQPPTGTKVALSLFHSYSLRWDEAKLVFCQDLEKFIRRQERVLSKA